MSENELKDTQPSQVNRTATSERRSRFPTWLAILVVLVLIAIGILGGYSSGMGKRYAAADTLVTGQLLEQYQLGLQAANAKQYEVAKLHFDYILQRNPDFPGVKKAYADLLLQMMITPTPSPTPSPTITPTPDLRGADQMYNNLVALLSVPNPDVCGYDWNDIIGRLDSLRKADITYHAADVDGMYFIALRNRGVCKIYPQKYEPNATCSNLNINLEGGIYDLTLAEHFGPLDNEAQALRTSARLYITGSSFWDQDWDQVLNYFSQLRNIMPYMSDSSCMSATERWRQASIKYAEWWMQQGNYCKADDQLLNAFTVDSPKNADVYPTATAVRDVCAGVTSGTTPVSTP